MGGRSGKASDPAVEAGDALYGGPLDQFVAERKRLAAELRAKGAVDAADRVASLAKPTVSAWVVNRLYRDDREEMDALLAVGRRMRAGEVAATREQRAVLATLHQRAGEILRDGGHAASPGMLRRVTTTLQALSAAGSFDPDPPGQLAEDRDPPGFDLLAGVTIAPAEEREEKPARRSKPEPKAAKAPKEPKEPPPDPAERQRKQRAEAQRKLLEHSAVQAGRRADARQREVDGLRDELERAEATAERLRTALRGAQDKLDEARAAADEAVRALNAASGD
jgi:hypothetical protein